MHVLLATVADPVLFQIPVEYVKVCNTLFTNLARVYIYIYLDSTQIHTEQPALELKLKSQSVLINVGQIARHGP